MVPLDGLIRSKYINGKSSVLFGPRRLATCSNLILKGKRESSVELKKSNLQFDFFSVSIRCLYSFVLGLLGNIYQF